MRSALAVGSAARRRDRMVGATVQTGLRVLVVEDDPIFQSLLRGWLEGGQRRYDVTVAASMEEARRQVVGAPFDLVLLDLNLPDSDGLDTLHGLQDAAKDVPVVVLTSHDDEETGVAAVRQGAQDFVQKAAVDPDALKRNILYAVERRRLEDLHQRALRHEIEARRLREIDQAKNRFYQAAARGLQGPIQPLRFGVQLLQMELQGRLTPGQSDTLQSLQGHVEHLERLVADLVDIAALQAGSMELERRALDLRRLAVEAVDRWRPQAETNRLRLVLDAAPDTLVDADPRRIRQVLDHLLDNAMRSTPAGGRIDVLVRQEGDRAVAVVADTGVGAREEDIQRLTEVFLAGDAEGGRGVGLALCKGIVERHGGTFGFQSRGEGLGATVRFVLPIVGTLTD